MLKKHEGSNEKVFANIYSSSFVYSMIAIVVVACLEIFMLAYTFMNSALYGSFIGKYRTFYISLLASALLYIGLLLYTKKDIGNRYKILNIANPVYTFFFFAWALGITYYDFSIIGVVDTTVFMTFSLVIPLGFYVLPQVYALIVILADAFMMYLIFRASGGIGQVINTGIFIIFQLVLGVSFLLMKTQLAERIVQEQKNADIDALTGCGNRRAYNKEMDLLEGGVPQTLSYLAIDINGLKDVNDTYGHDTGDKLIIGAAECIERCFGKKGRIYRTGGDEFIVVTTDSGVDQVLPDYDESMKAWSAKNHLELSTSYGVARSIDYPETGIFDLAKIADRKMFDAKAAYYQQNGRERRRRSN